MDLNKDQNRALEDVYEIARIYGKLSTYLNEMADSIKREAMNNEDSVYIDLFATQQVYRMRDHIRMNNDVYTRANECLNNVSTAFVIKD